MFMISTMMGYIISMHLYYESGVAAVAVDRSATSNCMNRTRRSYRWWWWWWWWVESLFHRHGLVVETRLNVLAEEKGEGDDAMTFCCD
jgi:hypothetical protein